ncbi:allantoate amidohydrolase [Nonomuraea sp. NPDC023979]|uniref:allantoate amidohydrolase n=1 Tax=Nonomuraea sp. NPDC023979 TaxID=3154796 RepID=UPI0033F0461F
MLEDLARVGRDPATGGYVRDAWSHADQELREWFAGEATRRGLDLREDRNGNLWAWWGDPAREPGVVTGSHLDSVRQGGAYDGPLGVVSAFAAIDLLRRRGFQPRRPLGVVCFTDEEGARFGVPCVGSRLLTGALTPERALGLTDDHGDTLADVLTRLGRDPRALGPDPETLRAIGVFVELHVEQGKGLVEHGRPVGVASGIWPHGRWRFDLRGQANHAGTTRLADRHDPMLALARLVLAAREHAARRGVVATVGKVLVSPNNANAVPGLVSAWLDARGPAEADVRALVADLHHLTAPPVHPAAPQPPEPRTPAGSPSPQPPPGNSVRGQAPAPYGAASTGGAASQGGAVPEGGVASVGGSSSGEAAAPYGGAGSSGGYVGSVKRRGFEEGGLAPGEGSGLRGGVVVREESWTPLVGFDVGLRERVGRAVGGEVPVLATGAGHDAGILAAAGVPSAMLFVRNPTGVSHAPDEHAEQADCEAGVAALANVLEELCR